MECTQRRITKLIPSLKDLSYEESLRSLELITLKERRVRGDMIVVFKILNGIEKIDHKQFFAKKNRINLRGHSKKLTAIQKKRKQFIPYGKYTIYI